MDAKEIVDSSTPLGATKLIASRFLTECTPPEIFIIGKCVIFLGGVIASVSIVENPLVVSGIMSTARSIIKDL